MPFLDRDFLDVAMTLDPHDKMIRKADGRMEKYILRKVHGEFNNTGGWSTGLEGGDSAIAGPRLLVCLSASPSQASP